MPLERDHILLYGPKIRIEDGVKHRDKILQPCGCWTAEVWREVAAPTGINAINTGGHPEPVRRQWCRETRQCDVHSAAAVVLQLKLGERLNGTTFTANLGDGAKRLLTDADRVLAEATTLDRQMRETLPNIPVKQLPANELNPAKAKRRFRKISR